MLSFWESKSFTEYDVAIVGAGITGLSAAIEFKLSDPKLEIVVLERGLLPTGASTKNAGFACVGSLTEIVDDLKTMSEKDVVDLVRMRRDGLQILRNRLGDLSVDYQEWGSYELCMTDVDYSADIAKVNNLLLPIYNRSVFKKSKKSFGFSKAVKTIIESSAEGQIDTGKMMKALGQFAIKLGIEIKTGYEVLSLNTESDYVSIEHNILPLKAKQVCVCANAFAGSLIAGTDIKPGRGQVLITKPIVNLPFKGIFHFDEGYYYFRTIQDRVLFGGGRQIDFEAETSFDFELNQKIQRDLEEKLRLMILPGVDFEIDRRWTGIMAFGNNKKPIIKQVDKRIFAAVRLGGMGIAIGSKVAKNIVGLMLEEQF